MDKIVSFILIILVVSMMFGWKFYERIALADINNRIQDIDKIDNDESDLAIAQRTQLNSMAKEERSKVKVMVEHDSSPLTNTYPVILDASESYDPDLGDEIFFKWKQISGITVDLKPDNESSKVSFEGVAGEYEFELIVYDNYNAKNKLTKIVVIEPEPNVAPVIEMKVRQGSELR